MSAAADQLLALLGRVGADETASAFAFVSAVGSGIVPTEPAPPRPPTEDELCSCGHLAVEHKLSPVGVVCLGDVQVPELARDLPCACSSFERVELPMSQFRP